MKAIRNYISTHDLTPKGVDTGESWTPRWTSLQENPVGERLSWITRHMLGLYSGQPGAKEFRRRLSEGARDPRAGPELLLEAGRACEQLDDAAA